MQEIVRLRIMQILANHRGREYAIPRRMLQNRLFRFAIQLDDRKLRSIYASLPICSCEDGLFIPRTPEEVREYREYLRPHMAPEKVAARIGIILSIWPNLQPSTMRQLEMFDGNREAART